MEVSALSQLRHELRTPLNHVIGYSEMLIEDVADAHPALAETLRGLHADAHRLLGLINSLLASADTGVTPERLAQDLGPSIDALVGVCRQAREAGAAAGNAAVQDLDKIAGAAALADAIVAGGTDDPLKTHRREITVAFLDLRGYTAFTETAEPEDLMGVLREYHGAMGQLILEHEGTSSASRATA